MKSIKVILFAAAAIFALAGCNKDPHNDPGAQNSDFLAQTKIGVYTAESPTGSVTKKFPLDEDAFQYAFSPTKKTSRIQSDDMTQYIQVTVQGDVVEKETISPRVLVSGLDGITASTSDFVIEKIDRTNNLVWLWKKVDSKNMGIITYWEN